MPFAWLLSVLWENDSDDEKNQQWIILSWILEWSISGIPSENQKAKDISFPF